MTDASCEIMNYGIASRDWMRAAARLMGWRGSTQQRQAEAHDPSEVWIEEGMEVRGSDGEKLGKVIGTQAESFMVEKGFLFPRDCLVSWSEVTDIRDGTIHVARTKDELGLGRRFDQVGVYGFHEGGGTPRSAAERREERPSEVMGQMHERRR